MIKKTVIFILVLILSNIVSTAVADTTTKAWLEGGFGFGEAEQLVSVWSTKLALLDKEKNYSIHYFDFDCTFNLFGPFLGKARSKSSSFMEGSRSRSLEENRYYRVSAVGAQYGLSKEKKSYRLSLSAGLSYLTLFADRYDGSIKKVKTIGVPLSADIDLLIFKYFGLKSSLNMILNSEQPIHFISLSIMLGRLR